MQKYEYLIALQARGYLGQEKDSSYHRASDWQIWIYEKGQDREWKGAIIDLINKLGDEGWDLVSVTASSGFLGGSNYIGGTINPVPFTNGSAGTISGITTDFAGYTTNKEWVFKRPRE